MSLEKITQTTYEIDQFGFVFVITQDNITEDGKVISAGQSHRRPIAPDADLSEEEAGTKAICEAAFTDEVKADYAAKQAKAEARRAEEEAANAPIEEPIEEPAVTE